MIKKQIVVYGSFNSVDVRFLEEEVAEQYANLFKDHADGIKFHELHNRYPDILESLAEYKSCMFDNYISHPDPKSFECDEYFDELFNSFYEEQGNDFFRHFSDDDTVLTKEDAKYIYENEVKTADRFPLPDEKFDNSYIEKFELFESVLYYGPTMSWVPKEIIDKYGKIVFTIHDGEVLRFLIKDTNDIVKSFERTGYICIRDDLLISKAYAQT